MTTYPRSMDGYGSDDMALPELKLVQNVGGDYAKTLGANPGDLFLSLSDEIIKSNEGLDIIIADIKKTRTYWGRTEIEDAPPECASIDADSMKSIAGNDCSTCEHRCDAPGLIDTIERRGMCVMNYVVLAINVADNMPLMIRAGGISTKPVRELITQLKLNRELKGEYHRAKIHVTSVPKKSSAGEAFAFHLKVGGLITDATQAKELLLQSQQILGVNLLPMGHEPETAYVRMEPEPEPYRQAPEVHERLPAPETQTEPEPESAPEVPETETPEAALVEKVKEKVEAKEAKKAQLDVDF